jgi:hypothetical protein
MILGVMLLVTGWILIIPGRRRRGLAIIGGMMVTAAMFSIVQARY